MIDLKSKLSFKISTGLKNIIGRDLISDKYIAIFELVKNSYDAGASKVNIEFLKSDQEGTIIIIDDNGCGMSYDDIVNKWLFVAYSEKKVQNRSQNDFRNQIKRDYAGAKGVGRFSCDRLGANLQLITKTISDKLTHLVDVDWNNFEYDDTRQFMDVPVDYQTLNNLSSGFTSGTTLRIRQLREDWDRNDLLKLKRSLMKLISPDAYLGQTLFDVKIIAKHELENDKAASSKKDFSLERDTVNGFIHNDVIEKLQLKTTNLNVTISSDGKEIMSTLYDRGQFIFTITEKNREFTLLNNIHTSIFYLNKAAKINFTRQMGGVQPVNYGSIFIYKNGFRINPYGEPGQDFFNIDQRKAQGYNRYLGTRELMGRISIKGANDQFIETSSRAHGFIMTPTVEMFASFFLEKVLKVLEKYVVNIISWGEPLKTDLSHIIAPNEVGAQIISQFVKTTNPDDIIKLDYNHELFEIDNMLNNPENLNFSIKNLETLANKTQNESLIKLAKNVRVKTENLLSYNIQLEQEKSEKEKELDITQKIVAAREKQVYFLKGTTNQNVVNLLNGYHTIYTLTDATKANIDELIERLNKTDLAKNDFIFELLNDINKSNDKAHKWADLAIHGNQSLETGGKKSVNDFLQQYIDSGLANKGLQYYISAKDMCYECEFDSASLGVVFDNLVSNSMKAGATRLDISIIDKINFVEVSFTDNGFGLSNDINTNMLFEWGISTNTKNKGFGIGLYHIRMLVNEMHGEVSIDSSYKKGFRLVVNLKK